MVGRGAPLRTVEPSERVEELETYIALLGSGDADVLVLQKLVLLCLENPVLETSSPPLSPAFGYPTSPSPFIGTSRSLPSLQAEMWEQNKGFERLFNALIKYLEPIKVSYIFFDALISTNNSGTSEARRGD